MEELIKILESISNITLSMNELVEDEQVSERIWSVHLEVNDLINKFSKVSA